MPRLVPRPRQTSEPSVAASRYTAAGPGLDRMTLAYVAWETCRTLLAVNALADQRQLADIEAAFMKRMDGALGTSVAVEEVYGGRGEISHVSKCREVTLTRFQESRPRKTRRLCGSAHIPIESRY